MRVRGSGSFEFECNEIILGEGLVKKDVLFLVETDDVQCSLWKKVNLL